MHLHQRNCHAPMGVGLGVGAGASVFSEITYRHQTEVAALKNVQARPCKPLRNPINPFRSKYVVVRGGSQDTTASPLPSVWRQYSTGLQRSGALPFQQDFAEGSFGAFRL